MSKWDFEDLFLGFIGFFTCSTLAFALIGLPVIIWKSAGVVQPQLNKDCGTNYSQMDVFLSSAELTELCKIKNQQVTLNK